MNEKNAATARRELSRSEYDLIVDVLNSHFPDLLGLHEGELLLMQSVFEVAAALCGKAADLHHGLQVPWSQMCFAARLPCKIANMPLVQDQLEFLLAPLGIDVIRQDNPRKGCSLPNFRVATDEVNDLSGLSELPDSGLLPEDENE